MVGHGLIQTRQDGLQHNLAVNNVAATSPFITIAAMDKPELQVSRGAHRHERAHQTPTPPASPSYHPDTLSVNRGQDRLASHATKVSVIVPLEKIWPTNTSRSSSRGSSAAPPC